MMVRFPGPARFGEDVSAGPTVRCTVTIGGAHHEVGNPAGDRPSLRHGNHDVHRSSLTGNACGACVALAARAPSARSRFQNRGSLRMKIRVLGSAAGGGFPQWNCNCRNCSGLRGGTLRARARTQSSIAVSGGADPGRPGGHQEALSWVLINASPDILAQLRAHPDFQPARASRDTAVSAIVLVDGQVDHTTGLYMLRESTRSLALWCTDAVYADLTRGNPILEVLSHYCGIERRRVSLDGNGFAVEGAPALHWHALPIAGKPALKSSGDRS